MSFNTFLYIQIISSTINTIFNRNSAHNFTSDSNELFSNSISLHENRMQSNQNYNELNTQEYITNIILCFNDKFISLNIQCHCHDSVTFQRKTHDQLTHRKKFPCKTMKLFFSRSELFLFYSGFSCQYLLSSAQLNFKLLKFSLLPT